MNMNNLNTRVLKEPLGFIRVIELPLAILAFATACGYYMTTNIKYNCPSPDDKTIQSSGVQPIVWGYPFNLVEPITVRNDFCVANSPSIVHPFYGDAVSQSQFFVFIGVISFLYTLISLAIYIWLWPKYENDTRFALGDFVVTAILALFWFISSCAWASGVTTIKDVTDHDTIINRLTAAHVRPCNLTVPATSTPPPSNNCTPETRSTNYASLNVSIIAGFACFGLWAANLWFIYKETGFYKARMAAAAPPVATGPGSVGPSGTTAAGAGRMGGGAGVFR